MVVTPETRKVKNSSCKWLDHFGLASPTSSGVLHIDAERAVPELVGTSAEKYTFMVRRARPQQHQTNGGARSEDYVRCCRLRCAVAHHKILR